MKKYYLIWILSLIILLGLVFVLINKEENFKNKQEIKQEEITKLMKNRCSVNIGPKPEYCY